MTFIGRNFPPTNQLRPSYPKNQLQGGDQSTPESKAEFKKFDVKNPEFKLFNEDNVKQYTRKDR